MRWLRGLWLPVWLGILTAGVFFVYQRIESHRLKKDWVAATGVRWDSLHTQVGARFDLQDSLRFADEDVALQGVWVQSGLRETLDNLLADKARLWRIFRWQARYQAPMEEVLIAQGIPADLAYLSCVYALEDIRGNSPLNLWRLSEDEALHYGLRIDEEVDERASVYRATGAAASALRAHYAQSGHWVCALRAYLDTNPKDTLVAWTHWATSCGAVSRATEQAWLRVLAVRALVAYPEGAQLAWMAQQTQYLLPQTTTYLVQKTIPDLSQWAARHHLSYGDLVHANPWLRGHSLTPKKNTYYLLNCPEAQK